MPDGKGATLLEDLPEEIIDNILVRLPSKDVGRCRAVSASWRNATSTPEFMLRHHRRQPSLPIIRDRGMLVALRAGASSQQELWPFLLGAKHRPGISLRGACDGLILAVTVSWRPCFYVCNPLTRKHALLPQPQPCQDSVGFGRDIQYNIVGFYRHHSTGEHSGALDLRARTYILQFICADGRMRQAEARRSPVAFHGTKATQRFLHSKNLPVAHRGNLHWHPYVAGHVKRGVDGQVITVFDGEAEKFRWMRCPTQVSHNTKLFSVKGAFACSGTPGHCFTAIHVWVMLDYDAETWAFSYRIDASELEASRQLNCSTSFKNEKGTPIDLKVEWFYEIAMLNERELLILFDGGHVLRCDTDGRFLGMVHIRESQYYNGDCRSLLLLTEDRFQESIIPIPCNEMQQDDKEEPFSIRPV